MIPQLLIASLAALCLAAFSGCGPEPLAGGTIETTNGITARVVLPSGNPASNIKVFLLDEQEWLAKTKSGESIFLDSAETDTAGVFNFKKVDTSITVSLYADVETYGFLIHDVSQKVVTDHYGNVIGMAKKVSYQGTIKDTTFDTEKIYLAGTPFEAAVDTAGNFVIKNVPPESYAVVIQRRLPDDTKEYVVGEKVKLDEFTEGKPVLIVPDTTKAVLIEDFEDKDNSNLLHTLFGFSSWWEATDDVVLGGNSTLLQPTNAASGSFAKAIRDGTGDRGNSLQVLYTTGTRAGLNESFPFVMMAANLGNYGVHYNLGGMDSLTFYSGGSGRLVVELVQQNPAGAEVSLQVIASKTFTLDAMGWTKYSIKPEELAVSIGWFPERPADFKTQFEKGNLPAYTKRPTTWNEMGGMVTQIRFKGTGGNEFWLDHIRVHGITEGDLVKK